MKVIVTTSRSILIVDVNSRTVKPIHRDCGVYYGITRHHRDIVVAARRRKIGERGGPQNDRGCLITFQAPHYRADIFEPEIPLLDLHGIASVGEEIWCTCSFHNAIAIWRDGRFSQAFPFGRASDQPYDRNHINTITPTPAGIFILAHNRGPSEVCLMNSTLELRRKWQLGSQAHNIWFDEDALRVCSSAEGRIVGLDGFEILVGGFPRGYASDGHMRLVGVSANVPRPSREKTDGCLVVYTMNYVQTDLIRLPGEGMVLDIMQLTNEEFVSLYNNPARTQVLAEAA